MPRREYLAQSTIDRIADEYADEYLGKCAVENPQLLVRASELRRVVYAHAQAYVTVLVTNVEIHRRPSLDASMALAPAIDEFKQTRDTMRRFLLESERK